MTMCRSGVTPTLALVLIATIGAGAAGAHSTPQIFLAVRTAQLPDPVTGFATLRSRTVHAPVAPAPRMYFGWLTARLQPRYARAMADFYPMRASGLHLGAGTRFQAGYDWINTSPDTRVGLLYDIRKTTAGPGLRYGFERFAPIALVGYDRPIAPGWRLGLDAGVMAGQAVSLYPFVDRMSGLPGPRTNLRDRANPIVDVTLSHAF